MACAEEIRLLEDHKRTHNWKRYGPYLSERQWGTVREDYSMDGSCWEYFPHDHARSRAYRWGEDGLLGITDRQGRICLSFALWNGKDPILKERIFGLTNSEGNHGEDVKELYYYLDSTPTHSYMKGLYKYPQSAYPYQQIVEENRRRGHHDPEFEIEDTGAFNEDRFFDVYAEYGKNSSDDILAQYTIVNRGPELATVHFIPTVWYRNTWIWGCTHEGCTMRPNMKLVGPSKVVGKQETLGETVIEFDQLQNGTLPEMLFTHNETNSKLLYNTDSYTPYTKDAFHKYIVNGDQNAVNPKHRGTKVGAHYVLRLKPGEQSVVKVRFYPKQQAPEGETFGKAFDKIMLCRLKEADEFYAKKITNECPRERRVARQAYAGILWTKQFYNYIVRNWIDGDPDQPSPPESRRAGRNSEWKHLFNRDVISMPDKWEYPWYASWDLAFHMIPFANIDIDFAKEQLQLFLREWYMHPNGQIPAYEFNFGDVNPPVHAWAVMSIFKKSGPKGERDYLFLARCFQKLLMNFTWWVNRKDPDGRNIFSGGFLGLDNIGVFDRSRPLPVDGVLEQADGTAWMAFFCVVMLDIALELAEYDSSYEDMASKFFEHFTEIVDACNNFGGSGLWDPVDGFYYDHLRCGDVSYPLRVRSLVGIMPIMSCLVLENDRIQKLSGFLKRTNWFLHNRKDLASQISFLTKGTGIHENSLLLAVPTKDQLVQVLRIMLDENEFLSPYGIRSLSKKHESCPYELELKGEKYSVNYVPGESNTSLFGGNSNWRGPIWFPVNYLIIEALQRYDFYYGDTLKVECPTGSGNMLRLKEVSMEICKRLGRIFLPGAGGRRPCHGDNDLYTRDDQWKELILFYEFFHGDTGRGCGASHQTGWTALIATVLNLAHGANVDFCSSNTDL